MKDIAIYGFGKLGEGILKGLIDRGISVYHDSYNGPNDNESIVDYENIQVDILNSSKLKNSLYNKDLKNDVGYIIVTLVGSVLEKEIDFLLSLDIPLIILSTKYDEALISEKAKKAEVKVLMSQNMAFGIVDFWNRIERMDKLDESIQIAANVIESHQSPKADISGSAIKALTLFKDKGFNVTFPEEGSFKIGEDGQSGSFTWLRTKKSQIDAGISEEYLSGHGYHIIKLVFEIYDFNFIRTLSKYFSSLEKYSIEGIFNFSVHYEEKNVFIIHNINGRDIYTDGVVKSIDFLETKTNGIYSAIDVINSIASE